MLWCEISMKVALKGFEEGLSDAKRGQVDSVAYQINREYRSGVDIAQQLMAKFGVMKYALEKSVDREFISANEMQDTGEEYDGGSHHDNVGQRGKGLSSPHEE